MAYQNITYNVIDDRIVGQIDGFASVKQSIEKLLMTEQYEYVIYNWEYGVALKRLIGKPLDYIQIMVVKIITKQLMYDNRVTSVENFIFNVDKNKLYIDFDVYTSYGKLHQTTTLDYV